MNGNISYRNLDTKAKRPPKMNKIACISVRDIHTIDLIKIEITQSVFKFFALSRFKTKFRSFCVNYKLL